MNNTIRTDALVTEADVEQIKTDVEDGEWKRAIFEYVVREPELAILIADRFEKMLNLLQSAGLTPRERWHFSKQMSLLVWTPVVLLDRAHRREWRDFLPSDEVAPEPPRGSTNQDGGAV